MIWLLFKLFYIFVDDLFNQDVSELNINKAVKTNINKFIEKYNNYKIINFDSYNKYKVNIYSNKENLELMKNRANNYCNGLDK